MKYGLMYYKETDNLGDDIQTYAAIRFLPHIDYCIDREDLSCFIPKEKEYVSMIMNGWFLHNKLAWPPSPYINPLLISMHFTSLETIDVGDKYLEGLGSDYLKRYAKIGCRDTETEKRLKKHGVNTYFSGCMTLTLNKFEDLEKGENIVIVDVSDDVLKKVKDNTTREIKVITHLCDPNIIKNKTIEERMSNIENLLKIYQAAHVVITSRLHVALPSIALGTPVILVVKDDFEKDRLESFIRYAGNSFCESEFKKIDRKILEEYLNNPKDNSNEFIDLRNALIQKCEEFISECENNNLDFNRLPDIKEYLEQYVSRFARDKYLYEIIRKKAKENSYEYARTQDKLNNKIISVQKELHDNMKTIDDLKNKMNFYNSKLEELRNENTKLKKDNEKKEEDLKSIYNSRSWKIMEKYRNVKKKLKNGR